MTTMWSSPSRIDVPFRVDLAEIMDQLEPGWSSWRVAPERTGSPAA